MNTGHSDRCLFRYRHKYRRSCSPNLPTGGVLPAGHYRVDGIQRGSGGPVDVAAVKPAAPRRAGSNPARAPARTRAAESRNPIVIFTPEAVPVSRTAAPRTGQCPDKAAVQARAAGTSGGGASRRRLRPCGCAKSARWPPTGRRPGRRGCQEAAAALVLCADEPLLPDHVRHAKAGEAVARSSRGRWAAKMAVRWQRTLRLTRSSGDEPGAVRQGEWTRSLAVPTRRARAPPTHLNSRS
jgi:hypothetical protein